MGPLGVQEMLAIFVLALLLFGPKKLPELGRLLAKGLSEFRRAKSELKSTFETHLSELEREVQAEKYTAPSTQYSSAHYPYPYDESGRKDSSQDAAQVSERSPVAGTVPRGVAPANGVSPTTTDEKLPT